MPPFKHGLLSHSLKSVVEGEAVSMLAHFPFRSVSLNHKSTTGSLIHLDIAIRDSAKLIILHDR